MSKEGDNLMRSQRLEKKRRRDAKAEPFPPAPDLHTVELSMAAIASGRTRPIQGMINGLKSDLPERKSK
jgi:hypothetical protein